ncbi:hypothetical protein [Oryzomonas rubra]|uniref:Glycosyl transferase family 11 n=1 Tax=Oryzomonas rubra TaxID=2509454 RepID=A0A5A9XG27_9BACT|nr:hypothetical protein [Oryzomonas rubra]KAA0891238.1 hypothetical protein ET418_10655 [Oryzomonas rubra]
MNLEIREMKEYLFDHHVFLRGGIGNQFFQWAYAKKLQSEGLSVKLNTAFLKTKKRNQASGTLELLNLFSSIDIPVCAWKHLRPLEFVVKRLGKLVGVLEDDHLTDKPRPSRCLHYGHYQMGEVLNTLVLAKAKELIHPNLMQSEIPGNYCVLHVRAGDYLSNAYNFAHMGLLSIEYQVRAANLLLDRYPRNDLIIVSDNEQFSSLVLNALKTTNRNRVSLLSKVLRRNESQSDAITAMLSAEAISLSNSSFSAMCALLGKSGEVLYPRPWFISPDLHYISPVLNHWTALPSDFAGQGWADSKHLYAGL